MTTQAQAEPKKLSALEALKALSSKKPAPAGMAPAISDPAIAGAKRGKSKSTVTLGQDPAIAEDAATCAQLKSALDDATSQFKVFQSKIRDYGRDKRGIYNDTYKAGITTVCVPYEVEVPEDPNSATPGRETRHIQVICSNRYSVDQAVVLANKGSLGEHYDRLFTEEETKKLRPNAEDLIRKLLSELGVEGEQLDSMMSSLIETETKVATADAFESEVKKIPEGLQDVLAQAVTRAEPGLKF